MIRFANTAVRALAIATMLVVGAGTVSADPDPGAISAAKAHFRQGKAYQEAGSYHRAVDEYRAAYELDPRPEMLFNIAQAYRLDGDRKNAVAFFQRYIDAQPEGKGVVEAREMIARLTKDLDDERSPLPPSAPPPRPVPAPSPSPSPSHTPSPSPAAFPTIGHDDVTTSSPTLRLAGLITACAGVAAIAVGAGFGIAANRNAAQISSHDMGTWTPADHDAFDRGRAQNRDMAIAYVAGGGLVVTGAILVYLGMRSHVVPVVTPQTTGLAIRSAF